MTPDRLTGTGERESPLVAFAGPPEARPVLDTIARSVGTHGARTVMLADAQADLTAAPDWPNIDILVGVNVACRAVEMEAAPRLRGIVSPIIGYDRIDVSAATARGILVLNGRVPENTHSVAEATVLLLLAAFYDLAAREAQLRSDAPQVDPPPLGHMLFGKTVGIVGHGSIARGVIGRLSGWGTKLLVHTRSVPPNPPPNVTFVSLEDLLAQSDAVLLLADLNPSSRHLLDDRRLGMMKSGAVLVNTARGGLIDEAALPRHVGPGRIARIALDVFEAEPLPPQSPLRTIPGAILTGHNVGHSAEALAAIPPAAVANVLSLMGGAASTMIVNAEALPAWEARWGGERRG